MTSPTSEDACPVLICFAFHNNININMLMPQSLKQSEQLKAPKTMEGSAFYFKT